MKRIFFLLISCILLVSMTSCDKNADKYSYGIPLKKVFWGMDKTAVMKAIKVKAVPEAVPVPDKDYVQIAIENITILDFSTKVLFYFSDLEGKLKDRLVGMQIVYSKDTDAAELKEQLFKRFDKTLEEEHGEFITYIWKDDTIEQSVNDEKIESMKKIALSGYPDLTEDEIKKANEIWESSKKITPLSTINLSIPKEEGGEITLNIMGLYAALANISEE